MGRSFEVRKASMAKTAGQKTKVYSKYGKMLYVLAKNTGAEPATNPTLRSLIEKAKREQVPTHVIEKALEKASGNGGEDFVHARYEGFGPGGCSVIIDCLTDNNNRTITDVRNCFTKTGSKMGPLWVMDVLVACVDWSVEQRSTPPVVTPPGSVRRNSLVGIVSIHHPFGWLSTS